MQIKSLSKSELAHLYEVSIQTLSNWIDLNSKLKEDLKETDYQKTSRIFTPKQVSIIFKHLGEPLNDEVL